MLQLKIKKYSYYLPRDSRPKFDVDVPMTVADLGGGGALGASAPPAESMVKIS